MYTYKKYLNIFPFLRLKKNFLHFILESHEVFFLQFYVKTFVQNKYVSCQISLIPLYSIALSAVVICFYFNLASIMDSNKLVQHFASIITA